MHSTQRILLMSLGALISGVVLLRSTVALGDETATRFREATERFSWSNVVFYSELERTNPAMLRTMTTKWSTQEHRMVVNGYRKIPYLRQFTTLFPTNVDSRYFSPEPVKPHLWTMQTGLYGRYLLRMEVLFKVDSSWTNIVSYEPPSFFLITYDDHPPSSRGVSEGREFSRRTLTALDWTKLVTAGGDLAAIGFNAWTNRPIKGFESEWRGLDGTR